MAKRDAFCGDAMDRLWGEVAPVPEQALVVVQATRQAGGRSLEVAYPATPRIT